ncbi:MAG: helix-turn-helix domain-containing protein [Candidatus Hodarchaeales archaeon]
MSQPPITKLLEDFGLSSAEAEVLSILLQSPTTSLTGNAVARNTTITRYYVFSLLSRLVQKGFAAEIKERPRRYYSTLEMLRRTVESMEKDHQATITAIEESRQDPKKFFEAMGFEEEIAVGFNILQQGAASRKQLIERAEASGLELKYEHFRRITNVLVDRHYAEKLARGRTYYYQPASLEEIIDREKDKLREEWKERKTSLLRNLDALSRIVGVSPAQAAVRTSISIMRDAKAISRRILAEGLRAEELLCAQFLRLQFDHESYSKMLGTTFFNFVELVEAGVTVRCLVNDCALYHIATIPESILGRLFSAPKGFSMKITSQIMSPCVIISESCVFEFPLISELLFDPAILLDGPEIVKERQLEFDRIWGQSEDIRPYLRPLVDPITRGVIDNSMRDIQHLDFKIIVCGEAGVGKTSLVRRFSSGKYPLNVAGTIGTRIDKKPIDIVRRNESAITANLHIYDLSGDRKYRKINQRHLDGANGIIFVFDLHDESSLEAIHDWRAFVGIETKTPSLLVSTKKDDEKGPVITKGRIDHFMQEYKFDNYFSTSAKGNLQVDSPFTSIAKLILDLFEKQGRLPRITQILAFEEKIKPESARSKALKVQIRE